MKRVVPLDLQRLCGVCAKAITPATMHTSHKSRNKTHLRSECTFVHETRWRIMWRTLRHERVLCMHNYYTLHIHIQSAYTYRIDVRVFVSMCAAVYPFVKSGTVLCSFRVHGGPKMNNTRYAAPSPSPNHKQTHDGICPDYLTLGTLALVGWWASGFGLCQQWMCMHMYIWIFVDRLWGIGRWVERGWGGGRLGCMCGSWKTRDAWKSTSRYMYIYKYICVGVPLLLNRRIKSVSDDGNFNSITLHSWRVTLMSTF